MIRRKRTATEAEATDESNTTEETDPSMSVSRRGLLIGSTATGALLVGTYLGRGPIIRPLVSSFFFAREATPPATVSNGQAPHETWFEVPIDGNVILYMPKAEMGQGIHTALAQIAVEDLELRMDQLDVRFATLLETSSGTNSRGFGSQLATAGSSSIFSSYAPLRSAANTLKEMLLLEGAIQMGVSRAEVIASEGKVRLATDSSQGLAYSLIVKNRKGPLGSWAPPANVPPLKPRNEFKVIGTSAVRLDTPKKVTGFAVYGFDAKVDGLHFGAVARPDRYNARLVRAEQNNAAKSLGVVSVVVDIPAGFVGVVATTRKHAYDALANVTCTWEGGSSSNDTSIARQMADAAQGFDIHKKGDAPGVLEDFDEAAIVERRYYVPAVAHAHLEPLAAMAVVGADHVDVWVSTQQPQTVSADIIGVLKKSRTVMIHPTYLGGGFGRKFVSHLGAEAVRLSEASGKPVRVALSREEDMAMGPFRPPTMVTLRAGLANGRVVAIDQRTVSGVGDTQIVATVQRVGLDLGEPPGLLSPYRAVPNYRVNVKSLDLGIPTGIWRGVGLLPNSFANESFIDELAHAAQADPLQFRLDHLEDTAVGKNYARLLNEVAKRSNWDSPLGEGQGRGIAAAAMVGTIVTAVAQVTVVGSDIKVDQVFVCVDPGLVINPDGAKLQVAGGVMMSLSSAFGEQMSFKNGMASTTNLDSYYLLSAQSAPPIDVHLMGSGDNPAGLGEPGIGPVCAAVANAVFAATNKRLRTLPLALE